MSTVRPGSHRGLDEQCRNVIERHKDADHIGGEIEFALKKIRDIGVVQRVQNADPKETKTEQKDPAVVELHVASRIQATVTLKVTVAF